MTRPNYDEAINCVSIYAEKIKIEADKKGLTVHDLYGKKATRMVLESFLKKHKAGLVFFNGHGASDLVAGHDDEPILDKNNSHLLRAKITHVLGWSGGLKSGPGLVESGAAAFIGYKNMFCFHMDRSKKPGDDKIAAAFLESANQAPISLVKGNTVREAYQRSQETYDKWINYFDIHYTLESSFVIPLLVWDKLNQVVYGNENASLTTIS